MMITGIKETVKFTRCRIFLFKKNFSSRKITLRRVKLPCIEQIHGPGDNNVEVSRVVGFVIYTQKYAD